MIRIFIAWVCCCFLTLGTQGQNASNPFELVDRLPKNAATPGTQVEETVDRNPFNVVEHRAPGAVTALAENSTEPFRPFSILPQGGGMSKGLLFGILVVMMGFLSFSIAANRPAVGKAWRGFLNENALTLVQREASGLVGSTPYYLLYANFLLNGGMFLFLVARFFSGEKYNNFLFLLFCWVAAAIMFLSKHALIAIVRWLFPVETEGRRYNFLITIFNCVLGLFLVPFNLLLAFSTDYQTFLVFWILGLVTIFYGYRALRSAVIGTKFLVADQFHFLLYLCCVEIAPVLLLVKMAMIEMN